MENYVHFMILAAVLLYFSQAVIANALFVLESAFIFSLLMYHVCCLDMDM